MYPQGLDDGDLTLHNFDVVDEKTSLLKAEGGGLYHRMGSLGSLTMSLQPPPSQQSHPTSAQQLTHPAGTTPAAGTDNKPQVLISKEPSCESVQQPNTDKRSHGELLCFQVVSSRFFFFFAFHFTPLQCSFHFIKLFKRGTVPHDKIFRVQKIINILSYCEVALDTRQRSCEFLRNRIIICDCLVSCVS